MKKIIVAASALLALSAADAAAGEYYGNVSGGAMVLQDRSGTVDGDRIKIEYDTGWAVYGAAGYKFDQGFRVEGELGYGHASYDNITVNGTKIDASGDIDLLSGTVNGFYDFRTATAFTPYLGAGAGVVRTKISNARVDNVSVKGETETDFTLLGEAGVNYAINQSVDIGLGYRYTHLFNSTQGLDDNAAHLFKINGRLSF